ncbi:MAG: hypothetical protein IT381_27220 [Deltaproteobacteria bacterium]|nr:hypothetical protein [Deltaproteobacteria bacterium]
MRSVTLVAVLTTAFTLSPELTPVFIDKLGPGWQVSTWNNTKCDFVQSGSGTALSIVFTEPWGGCALDHKDAQRRTVPLAGDAYAALLFEVDSDDASLNALSVYLDNGSERIKIRKHVQAKLARLPMGDLNNTGGEFSRIVFFNAGKIGGITAKIDNIRFENARAESQNAADAPEQALAIKIDPTAKQAISPYIYGDNTAKNRNVPFVRLGGNRWSTYNWKNNASNSGIDFGPHSNDGHLSESNEAGRAVTDFIAETQRRKQTALITVPMLDWVAADKKGLVALPAGPDNDRFVPNTTAYQEPFVDLVERTKGTVFAVFYSLDNEPGLWASTHPLVHPDAATYQELADKTVRYAAMIKKKNKSAVVFGGVAYGFAELVNLQRAPDARGRDYTEFLLAQWQAAEQKQGQRLVDVFDLHWYTEVKSERGKILDSQSRTPSKQEAELRMQAPRSLWDPKYTEKTWITKVLGGPVKLLPRLKQKIDANYPGTKLAITEYNYGGGQHISGAIAQADALGIFGREGVYAANLWSHGYQKGDSYVYSAFDMFLDYDGKGGRVGATGLQATTSDLDASSVYAMQDEKGMQLVLINKTGANLNAAIDLGRGDLKSARPYVLSAAGKKPLPLNPLPLTGSKVQYKMPPLSVTTLALTP